MPSLAAQWLGPEYCRPQAADSAGAPARITVGPMFGWLAVLGPSSQALPPGGQGTCSWAAAASSTAAELLAAPRQNVGSVLDTSPSTADAQARSSARRSSSWLGAEPLNTLSTSNPFSRSLRAAALSSSYRPELAGAERPSLHRLKLRLLPEHPTCRPRTCSPRYVAPHTLLVPAVLTALQFESKSSRAKGIAFHPKRCAPQSSPALPLPADLRQAMDPRLPTFVHHPAVGLPHGYPH